MAPNTTNPKPRKPAEKSVDPKQEDSDSVATAPITSAFIVGEPGVDSSRKGSGAPVAHPTATASPHLPIPIREATPTPKKSSATAGHKKTNSGDSTTSASSMRATASDRDNLPSREQTPVPQQQPRALEDMNGIGDIFGPRGR